LEVVGKPVKRIGSTCCWLLLVSLLGCASRSDEPVRLVLISPHRDEIREEVGQAFPAWFQERTEARAAAAAQAVATWLEAPDADNRRAAGRACDTFYQDWLPEDLPELTAAYRAWAEPERPTREQGQALLDAFRRWQEKPRHVELVWQDIGGGTAQILRYVEAQFQSNPSGIGIDVLYGGGTDIFVRLAEQEGRLQKLDADAPNRDRLHALLAPDRIRPQLNGVPLYDPGGKWFGPMLSSFGILCNREVLQRIGQPEPHRWDDLGAPKFQGWVSAGDPRMTGSLHMVYEIILQSHGWDEGFALLLRLGANTHSFIRDSGTLTRTVTNGDAAAAGNVDANALSAVGRNPNLLAYNLPIGETIINPDAVAVLKGAPHPQLAWAFVEFTLSDAGQKLLMLQPGEPGGPRRYPVCRLSVVAAMYDPAKYPLAARSVGTANPFAVKQTFVYDTTLGSRRWDALNDFFGAVVIDAHPDLTAAWQAVLHSRLPQSEREQLERQLFQAPITKEDLDDHARAIRAQSPRRRSEIVNRWGEQARQHYQQIRRAAEGG
jgi:ABC-type Fe3+ transport system substrate-binding protein